MDNSTVNQNKEDAEKRYQLAHEEWSKRVGSAESQLRNWRIACLLSFIMVIILAWALSMVLSMRDPRVYVAEVKPGEKVFNVVTVPAQGTPSNAEEAYFINQFLQYTMTLPIDPVLARDYWFKAYRLVEGAAVEQLTAYAKTHNPLNHVGMETKSIQIEQYHPVSNHSYEVAWLQTLYDQAGQIKSKQLFRGVFTLSQGEVPKSIRDILINPLGLKITYFTFSKEGEGS